MTEEEAKTKWCPMTRFFFAQMSGRLTGSGVLPGEAPMFAAVNTDRPDGACIGSGCMMWRDDLDRVVTGREIARTVGDKIRIEKETVPGGYCGLAGRPL